MGKFEILSKNQIKYLFYRFKCNEDKLDSLGVDASELCVDLNTFCFHAYPSVRVMFENLFESTLDSVDSYYVCVGCGHVYWVNKNDFWKKILF
jgi:hypothetical protein